MKLSTIITAYDHHPVTVVHVRESIRNSRMPDEIVVVNDHGKEDLRELLLDMLINEEQRCPITYAYVLQDIQWNYTGARNLGVWLSTGDILSMEDNDNIPTKDVYRDGIKYLKENPNVEYLLYGQRLEIPKEDILTKPVEIWEAIKTTPYHRDTKMMRRDVYLKMKGCDERFAGKYAWQCADWRRRLNRAGIVQAQIENNFYHVQGGDTESLVRRKSYTNYDLARESDGHTQSKAPLLNFGYTFERF